MSAPSGSDEDRERRRSLAARLTRPAHALSEQGDYEEAARLYGLALDVFRELDDAEEVATCLASLGAVRTSQGRLEEAIEVLTEARELLERSAPFSVRMAACVGNLAAVHSERGELDLAAELRRRAVTLLEQHPDGDLDELARRWLDVSTAELARGDAGAAMTAARRAIDLHGDGTRAPEEAAACLNHIGQLLHDRGRYERARRYYERALELAPGASARRRIGWCKNLAAALADLGLFDDAADALQPALPLIPEGPEGRVVLGSLLNSTAVIRYRAAEQLVAEGAVGAARESFAAAAENAQAALAASEQSGLPDPERVSYVGNLGAVLAYLDRPDDAHRYLRRAVRETTSGAPLQSRLSALANLGMVERARGDLDAAIDALGEAAGVAETLRRSAGEETARQQVFALYQEPYQALIAALFERDRDGDRRQAFNVAERSRARALVEALADAAVAQAAPDPEALARVRDERDVRRRMAAAHRRLAAAREAGDALLVDRMQHQLDELEDAREELRLAIRAALPAYAALEHPHPVDAAEARALLAPGTLMLAFDAVGAETYVWALRRDAFAMAPLRADGEALAALVESATASFRVGGAAGRQQRAALQRLGEILLGPLVQPLADAVQRVLIVPDGALHRLPFELLGHGPGGALLGDRWPLAYIPSATALRALLASPARNAGHGDFVGFGDPAFAAAESAPPLPGTRAEVDGIARWFPGRAEVHFGSEVTKARIRDRCRGFRYVHFATHAVLDDLHPLQSGLRVAPGDGDREGVVQVHELADLALGDAELVVCSACRTGDGGIVAGEGVIGFTRALLYAGTGCVVVSLWPVPDGPTRALMQHFYAGLRAGDGIAEALREARTVVRAASPDPIAWAGFVAVGLAWTDERDAWPPEG